MSKKDLNSHQLRDYFAGKICEQTIKDQRCDEAALRMADKDYLADSRVKETCLRIVICHADIHTLVGKTPLDQALYQVGYQSVTILLSATTFKPVHT